MNRLALLLLALCAVPAFAQTPDDIPVGDLPAPVKAVLDRYLQILRTSATLDDAAAKLPEIAGGSLIDEDPVNVTLRGGVQPYSLKKDWSDVKFYADPVVIKRVTKRKVGPDGFGPSAIQGTRYTMYIGKKDGSQPAPISIQVPEGHPVIKVPKLTGIGSL